MTKPNLKWTHLYGQLCIGVSLGILILFTAVMVYAIKTEPVVQFAAAKIFYMSFGNMLFIIGHAAYGHFHPAQKPHSFRSAIVYTICFAALWIISELFKKR